MHLTRTLSFPFLLVFCLAGLSLLAGCGTGTYKNRMQESLAVLEVQSPFLRTLSSEDVVVYSNAGYGIELRRPKIFADPEHTAHLGAGLQYRFDGLKRYDGRVATAESRSPTGLVATFEEAGTWKSTWQALEFLYQDKTGGAYPAYAYFAFVPEEEATPEQLKDEILSRLKSAFPDAEIVWEEIEIDQPDGETSTWQHLSVTGDMAFDVRFLKDFYQPDEPLTNYPARMDLYLAQLEQPLMAGEDTAAEEDTGETATRPFTAIIAWRAPNEIGEKFKVFAGADAAMGTVTPAIEVEDKSLASGAQPPVEEETETETPSGPILRPRGDRARQPAQPSAEDTDDDDSEEAAANPASTAGTPGDFRWMFEQGDGANITLEYTSSGRMTTSDELEARYFEVILGMELEVQSVDVDENGQPHYQLRFTINDVMFERIYSDSQGAIESESSGYDERLDQRIEQATSALVDQPFSFTIDQRGRIEQSDFTELFEEVLATAEDATGMSFFSQEGLQNVLGQSIMEFPERKINPGGQWQVSTVCMGWPLHAHAELNYTFDSVEDQASRAQNALLTVELAGLELQAAGQGSDSPIPANAEVTVESQTASGRAHYDITRGLLTYNQVSQTYEYVVKTGRGESTCTMNTTTRFNLAPTR